LRLEIRRALGSDEAPPPLDQVDAFPTLDDAIREHIERALVRTRGKIEGAGGAAKLLGLHANTLRSRMEKLGVEWERFRPSP
jgi:transcriptional regulator with GAF, ATPase, and Fis domain